MMKILSFIRIFSLPAGITGLDERSRYFARRITSALPFATGGLNIFVVAILMGDSWTSTNG
ncbi:hypothetical protein BO71DRAFT_245108 [Aspergillus ellipticus CBS 707.79]|uniref:Uncharacterized protein n=1 Tax=Aspergillus ellipticus CBS 707.79 TaxID=1448320 RepID=A0A319DRI8_9EURO|nr:hypothetical protein BO71DRAFT_245108 [Aspergillus ellipticus CBS 707.79]